MGSWDKSAFGNDSALDWLDEVEYDNYSPDVIQNTLESFLAQEDYVEVDEGSAAYAAVGLVACAHDGNEENVPEEAIKIAKRYKKQLSELKGISLSVLSHLEKSDNELIELWRENDDNGESFLNEIRKLRIRLS